MRLTRRLILVLLAPGLALATALSAFLNAGLLGYLLYRQGVLVFQPGWGRYAVQLGGGSLLMGAALYFVSPHWQVWLEFDMWQRIRWVSGLVVLGGGLYFLWLTALGLRPRHFRMNS